MADNKQGPAIPKEPIPGNSTNGAPEAKAAASEVPKTAPKPPNPVFKMMGEFIPVNYVHTIKGITVKDCDCQEVEFGLRMKHRTPKDLAQTPLSKLDDLLHCGWNLEWRNLL